MPKPAVSSRKPENLLLIPRLSILLRVVMEQCPAKPENSAQRGGSENTKHSVTLGVVPGLLAARPF